MPNAAQRIRKFFRFFVRPKTFGATVLIRSGDEILLADYDYGHGWNFPTASLREHGGESPTECAYRFLRQEFTLTMISPPKYLGIRYCKFDFRRDTTFCFFARIIHKNIQINNKHIRSIRWFPISQLPNNLSPFAKEIVDNYFKKIM